MKRPDFKIKRALINLSRTVVLFAEIFTGKNLRDSLKQNWLYYCLFTIGSLPMKVKIVLIMCLIDVISLVATGKTISGLSVNFWLSWNVEA